MRIILAILLCASTVLAADNVTLKQVPTKPLPPRFSCCTNIIISGLLNPPVQYVFAYPANCQYYTNGVNWRVAPCSLSAACTNLSANSITVSNGPVGGTVGIVTIQCITGAIYPTNLVLNAGCTGATFYWGFGCLSGCSNCAPFVCRINDISAGN